MEQQVLWCISKDLKVNVLDFFTGEVIKAWSLPSVSNNTKETVKVYTKGIYGDWMIIQPPETRVVYFWHHSLFGGKRKNLSNLLHNTICNTNESTPWYKIIPAEPWCSFCLSNCESFFISGTSNGNLCIWRITTGQLLCNLYIHYLPIEHLAISSDDKLLIVITNNSCIYGFDFQKLLSTGPDLSTSNDPFEKYYLFPKITLSSQDNSRISNIYLGYGSWHESILYIGSTDSSCKLYDCLSGTLLATFVYHAPIHRICVNELETIILAGAETGEIYMTLLEGPSTASTPYTFKGHNCCISSLELSTQGPFIVSGDTSGTIFVWDMVNKLKIRSFNHHSSNVIYFKLLLKSPFFFKIPTEDYNFPLIRPLRRELALANEKFCVSRYLPDTSVSDPIEGCSMSNVSNDGLVKLCNTYDSLIRNLFNIVHSSIN